MNAFHATAIRLHDEGRDVLPRRSVDGKRPLVKWKGKQRTDGDRLTRDDIDRVWGVERPPAVGLYLRPHEAVIDLDLRANPDVAALFDDLVADTYCEATPGGGIHAHFETQDSVTYHPVAGVDVLGAGSFVAVAPDEGRKPLNDRSWNRVTDIGAYVTNLLERHGMTVEETPKEQDSWRTLLAGEPLDEGERNRKLYKLGSLLRRYGAGARLLFAALMGVNEHLSRAPLDEEEIADLAAKIAAKYEPAHPGVLDENAEPQATPARGLQWISLDQIDPRAVSWLWKPRIARRTITILAGDPGTAKTWVLCDLAARVSTGNEWPDSGNAPVGRTLLLNAEDDPDTALRPRLDRLGADVSKVMLAHLEGAFDLQRDMPLIEQALRMYPDTVLLILDPLFSFVGGVDVNAPAKMRPILAPLRELAIRYEIAVVVNMHLNKREELSALHRILASMDIPAFSRSILMATEDRLPQHYHLFHVKTNLDEPKAPTLRYTFEDRTLKWLGTSDATIDALDGEPAGKLQDAMTFLRGALADGPRPQRELETEAKERNISPRTLWRAKEGLGLKSRRVGSHWEWATGGDTTA